MGLFNTNTIKKRATISNLHETHNNYKLIKKGDVTEITIDVKLINSILDHMLTVKDQILYNLDVQDREKFDLIFVLSNILKNTASYPAFRKLVDAKFDKIKTYLPLTVAWFLKGGLIRNMGDVPDGCNVYNAGNLSPIGKDIPVCEDNVIVAVYDETSQSYNFLPASLAKSDTVYLYVNAMDYNSLIGFTQEEKDLLSAAARIKINKLKVYGFDKNINGLYKLAEDIDLNMLKTRSGTAVVETTSSLSWIIIAVIVIFIILILIWALRK